MFDNSRISSSTERLSNYRWTLALADWPLLSMLSVAGYGGDLCAIVTKHRCCLPLPPAGVCVERLADACDPYIVIDSGLGAHCPVDGRLLKKPEESSYLMTHSLYSWPWHPKLSGTYTPLSSRYPRLCQDGHDFEARERDEDVPTSTEASIKLLICKRTFPAAPAAPHTHDGADRARTAASVA